MIKLWNYTQNYTKEWETLFQYNMDQVMHINKKFKKQHKVECNFGRQLKDILITI
jgi:hypothetical protein